MENTPFRLTYLDYCKKRSKENGFTREALFWLNILECRIPKPINLKAYFRIPGNTTLTRLRRRKHALICVLLHDVFALNYLHRADI